MKGILFAGDSFTWGEGLQYYSSLPDVAWDAIGHNAEDYTPAHAKFIESQRFARKVAIHFNTFEYCRNNNGGDNVDIFQFIDTIEKQWRINYVPAASSPFDKRMFRFELKDFDYIVVQLTDMFRSDIKFNYNGENRSCCIYSDESRKTTQLDEYIDKMFGGDIKLFINHFLYNFSKMMETKFRTYEANGIKKCFFHTWQNEIIPYVNDNPYLKERFITYNDGDNDFQSIWDLQSMDKRKPGMSISDDPYFQTIGKKVINGHTSLTAHNIQAKAIIKKIEEYEQTTIHTL